ncbi:hypothetical protein PanWU01x14_079210 [Parasponia andersonii]|uniref:Uncharacterized protein n=1 Tax=Parasponia andersonii TaxID=3476 RepID=A0A2P5DB87_PARAD|nr:hypothetical protein PanWU01x14_079210 [Parasponia andersonii]
MNSESAAFGSETGAAGFGVVIRNASEVGRRTFAFPRITLSFKDVVRIQGGYFSNFEQVAPIRKSRSSFCRLLPKAQNPNRNPK